MEGGLAQERLVRPATTSTPIILWPDIVEASGMRDYHCGATPWQVDALQTNLHFGPSRQQKWSDPTIVVNK